MLDWIIKEQRLTIRDLDDEREIFCIGRKAVGFLGAGECGIDDDRTVPMHLLDPRDTIGIQYFSDIVCVVGGFFAIKKFPTERGKLIELHARDARR
jgi:hypothetical protein